jgi:zinc transport system ATP-binding protein
MRFKIPIFDLKNLTFAPRNQTVLSGVSFEIFHGEYVGIIGPNGGGKTTLIRILLGLEKPTSGEVKLYGKDIAKFRDWSKIGYVPQRAALIDERFPATVYDIVSMGRTSKQKLFSRLSKEDKQAIEDAMLKMDVLDLRDRMVGELSGGQRQRVMIARSLASDPEVLILDEPNTGVDMVSQKRFYQLLSKLNKEDQMTILFITHDVGVIADDIARLFTINQKATICNDPKKALSCEDMSELYGNDAHLIHNHRHGH